MMKMLIDTVITALITALVTGTITYTKATKKNADALKDGVLSLLRLMIIQQHDKYIEKGYCSINEKSVIETAYNAYHNLGGNGAITIYYNEIMALPDRKD